MRNSRLLRFLPSIGFALLWLHVVTGGAAVENAMKQEIRSPVFITTMNYAIDDPWLHNSALRRYFQKLRHDNAPRQVWAKSEWLGYALWNQYQYTGAMEIMITIAQSQGLPQKAAPWVNRYATIFPNGPHSAALLEHITSDHQRGEPLTLISRNYSAPYPKMAVTAQIASGFPDSKAKKRSLLL
ncbi:MAG: hypothetical protein Q9M26_08195 [Mariprofundales bacterium]|nr:hypothetical protein [Mariprofundales bacterium]